MNASVAQKFFICIALVLAGLSVAVGVSDFLAAEDSWIIQHAGRTPAVLMAVYPAIMIAAGLGIYLRSRLLGGGIVSAGAIAFGVLMSWTIFVPILALVAVALWAVVFRAARRPNTALVAILK